MSVLDIKTSEHMSSDVSFLGLNFKLSLTIYNDLIDNGVGEMSQYEHLFKITCDEVKYEKTQSAVTDRFLGFGKDFNEEIMKDLKQFVHNVKVEIYNKRGFSGTKLNFDEYANTLK